MSANFKNLSQILRLDLKRTDIDLVRDFPLLVPDNFVKKIKKNNPNDPLLLQVLPTKEELKDIPSFNLDPLSEKVSSPVTGMIHKCPDRVLLLVTNSCAINCRFCFRRHMRDQVKNWEEVLRYIESDALITEVILSGGDPLVLPQNELQRVIDQLNNIKHIKRIRIHSRLPIVDPEKVAANFVQSKIPLVLVVHCNHPNEIDASVVKVIELLRKQDIVIFNQSVLLKGINDKAETLITLSEKLFNLGIIPYYLHMLDKVKGAAHFCVEKVRAKEIYQEMQKQSSGYLVPKLVSDGSDGKRYL